MLHLVVKTLMGKQWYYLIATLVDQRVTVRIFRSALGSQIGKHHGNPMDEALQTHQKSRNKDTPVRMKSENKTGDTKKSRKKEREKKKTMRDRRTKSRKTQFLLLCFPVTNSHLGIRVAQVLSWSATWKSPVCIKVWKLMWIKCGAPGISCGRLFAMGLTCRNRSGSWEASVMWTKRWMQKGWLGLKVRADFKIFMACDFANFWGLAEWSWRTKQGQVERNGSCTTPQTGKVESLKPPTKWLLIVSSLKCWLIPSKS